MPELERLGMEDVAVAVVGTVAVVETVVVAEERQAAAAVVVVEDIVVAVVVVEAEIQQVIGDTLLRQTQDYLIPLLYQHHHLHLENTTVVVANTHHTPQ